MNGGRLGGTLAIHDLIAKALCLSIGLVGAAGPQCLLTVHGGLG